MQITEELQALFKTVRSQMGAPVRKIQITDEQMCDFLSTAIGDYAEKVQNWIIESQWMNLYGKSLTSADMAFALSMRTFDMAKDYSYYFSKEVGLQQRGPWELKKDYFKIEPGKQCYVIPAGREINKVFYVTPSTTKAALFGNAGGFAFGSMGGAMGMYGAMGYGVGSSGFYVGAAYDTFLMATDLVNKNSLIRGDLAYKVTAGPEGTHIVHLMSVPGSPNAFLGTAVDDMMGWRKYCNWYVWYSYYDTNDGDLDECEKEKALFGLRNGNSDILISPDQVPLSEMQYDFLNGPTKATVRKLLFAQACITLGLIRGTYNGKVQIPNAELTLDYNMYLELGKTEREKVMDELKERLERMTPWAMLEKQAGMIDNLRKIKAGTPLGIYKR